ncbi:MULTISPECIES: aminopeptidase P family protein [unclassified Pseudonocardia]|uniref:aminopeptidase P family protein n=1 Tax=unclassified Pseudonocardia TaxID=2619320 RepID=UPI0007621111|nr:MULTISPECIES: aminopeptidase P family protein [unclassified Pseudonocardia]
MSEPTDAELDALLTARPSMSRAQLRLLVGGWAPPPPGALPWAGAEPRARRRAELADAFPAEWLVVPSGRPQRRCNDLLYPFRPGSDFTWLVGDDEPGSVLVVDPSGASTLYRDERPALGDPLSLIDGHRGAFWAGQPTPSPVVAAELGLAVLPLSLLPGVLADARSGRAIHGLDADVDAAIPTSDASAELPRTIARMRLMKDTHEIALLRQTAADTVAGFAALAAALPAAVAHGEAHLEGVFARHARTVGHGPAYNSVVGAGDHATVLHWMRNDGAVRAEDLVLVDAGVEGAERYAADVTRTFPVSGSFTLEQRAVYDVVFAAQEAALALVRPGAALRDLHAAALEVVGAGLRRLGVLTDEVAGELTDAQAAVRWMPHGIGHMLGVDLHDCTAVAAEWMTAPLEPGHVITVEPGVYLSPHDAHVPGHLRGIGVRIEDDVVVTEDGYENLTAALPRSSDDVERWITSINARGAA